MSAIAMRSGINANMLFKWRREHVRAEGGSTAAVLLPVMVQPVSGDKAMATSIGPVPPQSRSAPRSGVIELEFAGAQLRLRGGVDEDSLCSVLRALRQSAWIGPRAGTRVWLAAGVTDNAALSGEVQRSQEALKIALPTVEKLKVEVAYLRRMKYGRSSEQLEHAQLDLVGGQLAQSAVSSALPGEDVADREQHSNVTSLDQARKKRQAKERTGVRDLPAHLPRRIVEHLPQGGCDCEACGRARHEIGQDISEVLDYEPGTFHVVRHVRPKLACATCSTITQAPAPSRPIDRCMAGTGLLTHVLVSKYCDHTPLYRLCQIYARDGVQLQRSTLADWVAQAARLLSPLAEAIGRYVVAADKVHGDDTPIRVLRGAGAKARTGRLWVYVRDDRPSGDTAPPAVWFQYSANRKGEHPVRHLRHFKGILQADAFAGYHPLYEDGRVVEAACWSHARRKVWDNRIDELLPWAVAGELVKATPTSSATADKLAA